MLSYLIKATLIWAILLLVYELLYRKSARYTLNRIYLFAALAAGLVLPFIVLNINAFPQQSTGATALNKGLQTIGATLDTRPQKSSDVEDFDIYSWMWRLYIAGAVVMMLICIREIILILRKAIYGHFKTISGHRIFSNKHIHAPFSFMGWVFISNPERYTTQELNYILRHEAAHNSRKHWLDMMLMQMVFVVCWFHPLVWRYRYLLKLNHEYEADHIAASNEVYDYGHFLLRQTLLKGTPAIAHSFHFSPIKNRIDMLTHTRKRNSWKYIFAIPVLLTCTFVFAQSKPSPSDKRVRQGNVTTYNGHQFHWTEDGIDTAIIPDPKTGKTQKFVLEKGGWPTIYMMDNDRVFDNYDPTITPVQFRPKNQQFIEYIRSKFRSKHPTVSDSVWVIDLTNVIIDENGKICYYEMAGQATTKKYDLTAADCPLPYGKTLKKIIDECPDFVPASYDGKNVKVSYGYFTIYYRSFTTKQVLTR